MTDWPIIFSAPMILALLDGRKTMTRRLYHSSRKPVLKPSIRFSRRWGGESVWARVKPGDRLWVRETWKPYSTYAGLPPRGIPQSQVFYLADDRYAPSNTPWLSPIHMPRWASRLTLVVTATKIERLLDITEADAVREGVYCFRDDANDDRAPTVLFFALWDDLHGEGAAKANPAVVALSFSVHACNINAMDTAGEKG